MLSPWKLAGAAALAFGMLTACNGHSNSSPAPVPLATGGGLDGTGLQSIAMIAVPNVPAGSTAATFSYDFAAVDPVLGKYYLPDRTNKGVDVVSTASLSTPLTTIPGFTGLEATPETSGPNSVIPISGTSTLYATDVDAVRVVNVTTGQVTQSITTGTSGQRTDAACYDSVDKILIGVNGSDTPPYITAINTTTNTIMNTYTFTTASGLEDCLYDPGTKNFFFNNDGTPANPHGELDVIPAASIVAGTPTVSAAYPEGNCGPGGMVFGPNEELAIACDAPAGDQQITLIMNATTGAITKTITQVGGTDQIAYDPIYGRFYTASRNMTTTGIAGGTLTPVLGVIDANSLNWLGNVPTGSGAHSVAVDPTNGHVFVPIPATATAGGAIEVFGLIGGS